MKFTYWVLALLFTSHLNAQDILVLDNDEVIEAKVLSVSSEKIDYKRFDYLEGPTLSVDIQTVKRLIYENGSEENLKNFKQKSKKLSGQIEGAEMYFVGVEDADNLYSSTGPVVGSTATTLLFWPAGLVTSIVLSSVKPKVPEISARGDEFTSSPMYHRGYIEQAHKKKKRGVWTGFGAGTAVLIVITVVAASQY